MKRIVVVGGGAGGLELVARLGRKFRRREDVEITLVDAAERHLWKPLLHEVATGFMDSGADALEYRTHALKNGYRYCIGELQGLDRERREIELAPLVGRRGRELLPVRRLPYDFLVLAVGSVSNDFGTPGVAQYCLSLDRASQAVKLYEQLTEELLRFSGSHSPAPVEVAIVGGGATGVELAAVLHQVIAVLKKYASPDVEEFVSAPVRRFLRISLVEAGPRLLPPLPERISTKALEILQQLGVDVRVSTLITEATPEGLRTGDRTLIPACLMVWAAGVRGADFLRGLGGLENSRTNQLVVTETLQTTRDPAVFAIGDCASLALGEGRFVPPRAQAAHQMAEHCYRSLVALLRDGAAQLRPFEYQDMGSLVNLARYRTLGAMVAPLAGRQVFVEGLLARMAYLSLYRMHQIALHGYLRTVYFMWAGRIHHTVRRMIKLH